MNFSAIFALFVRSVRDDTRARSLIWARIGIAAAVLLAVIFAHMKSDRGGAPGLSFFSTVVWMNFIFICVAGMSYFASSVTEEKEEGTLGLLRMADLSPFAILLGKSASRLVGGLTLLLVQMPFAVLAITLGGVRIEQVVSCYALLCAFMFFACNAGLLASVLSPRTGVAGLLAGCIGALYLISLPILVEIALSQLDGKWKLLAPGFGLMFRVSSILSTVLSSRTMNVPILFPVLTMLGGGGMLLLLSRLCFERFCGESASAVGVGARLSAVGLKIKGRASRAWDDAVCWKDYNYIHGGTKVTAVKFCLYTGVVAWIAWRMFSMPVGYLSFRDYRWEQFVLTIFFGSFVVVMAESLFATSRIYRLECKDRTISGLILLPQETDQLLASKRKAVLRSLRPGLLYLSVSSFFMLTFALRDSSGYALFFGIQGVALVIAEVYFNHSLVAWFSLRMKWGGLPLALGVSWIGNVVAMLLAGLIFNLAAFVIMAFAAIAFHVNLRSAFRDRLLATASKD